MKRFICCLLLLAIGGYLLTAALAADEVPASSPAKPLKKKLLLIGIDGTRLDALKAAETPNIDKLIAEGAFSEETHILPKPLELAGGADTVSGPGWSNLLCGVWPGKHGVKDNSFKGKNYKEYPHFFVRLKAAFPELKTVSLENWKEIHRHILRVEDAPKGDIVETFEHLPRNYGPSDEKITARAVELLSEKDPDALFVYIANVDETGHLKGFHPSVPQYMAEINKADAHVGKMISAMKGRKTYAEEDWLVIICTDHGGRGLNHSKGHTYPETNIVFLLVHGPSVVKGPIAGPTAHVDVVATALTHLGVKLDPAWKLDGTPRGLKPAK